MSLSSRSLLRPFLNVIGSSTFEPLMRWVGWELQEKLMGVLSWRSGDMERMNACVASERLPEEG